MLIYCTSPWIQLVYYCLSAGSKKFMFGRLPLYSSSPPSQVTQPRFRIYAECAMQPIGHNSRRISSCFRYTGWFHRLLNHQLECFVKIRTCAFNYRLHYRYNRGVFTTLFSRFNHRWDRTYRGNDWRSFDFIGYTSWNTVEKRNDKVLRIVGHCGHEFDNLPGFLPDLMSMSSLFILQYAQHCNQ